MGEEDRAEVRIIGPALKGPSVNEVKVSPTRILSSPRRNRALKSLATDLLENSTSPLDIDRLLGLYARNSSMERSIQRTIGEMDRKQNCFGRFPIPSDLPRIELSTACKIFKNAEITNVLEHLGGRFTDAILLERFLREQPLRICELCGVISHGRKSSEPPRFPYFLHPQSRPDDRCLYPRQGSFDVDRKNHRVRSSIQKMFRDGSRLAKSRQDHDERRVVTGERDSDTVEKTPDNFENADKRLGLDLKHIQERTNLVDETVKHRVTIDRIARSCNDETVEQFRNREKFSIHRRSVQPISQCSKVVNSAQRDLAESMDAGGSPEEIPLDCLTNERQGFPLSRDQNTVSKLENQMYSPPGLPNSKESLDSSTCSVENDSLEDRAAVPRLGESDTTAFSSSSAENMIREWVKPWKDTGLIHSGTVTVSWTGPLDRQEVPSNLSTKFTDRVHQTGQNLDSFGADEPVRKDLLSKGTQNFPRQISCKRIKNGVKADKREVTTSRDVLALYREVLELTEGMDWEGFVALIRELHPELGDLWSDISRSVNAASRKGDKVEVCIEISPRLGGRRAQGPWRVGEDGIVFEVDASLGHLEGILARRA